jgi:hypothetical protein
MNFPNLHMKKLLLFSSLILINWIIAGAQVFTDSNLPVVIINTDGGASIPDNPKIPATMKIIYRGQGQRNYLSDQNNPASLNYNGKIGIEIRGSSSQVTLKKQYGFTTKKADNVTNNNVSLLGMPEENDWVLNGMVFDPALIRDYLCYNLSRQIGEYASRTAYCEVIINGDYKGLYLLQEKIKSDDNRVDIVKIDNNDNTVPNVTGGYITKADKTTGGDPVAWTLVDPNGSSTAYIHELPEPGDITEAQNTYIQSQFMNFAYIASTFSISCITGIPSIIDIPSFINYMIISEISSNADSYQFSTYFHKDRSGKLRAGPVWDNDLTFGNDLFFWGYNRSKTNIWQFSNGDNEGSHFWKDLYNSPEFRCHLAKRWNELIQAGQPLNQSSIETFIDQTAAYISEAVVRENALWGNTGSLDEKISAIKAFLGMRIPWITTNLEGYSLCANEPVPPLVITKIMFHPPATTEFPEGDDLEYIEITNNGDEKADLTGIYFGGTGLVYQFPANSSIDPNSSLILASNTASFRLKYGFSPWGRFARHLSNKGQNLVLCDGFGNIVDNVNYSDTVPWPEADGNGYYLKLVDINSDNNDPVNWTTSDDIITSGENMPADAGLLLFPNPVSGILYVQGGTELVSVTLLDIYGRKLMTINPRDISCEIDMAGFPDGIYFVRVETLNGVIIRKVIRD